MPHFQFSRFYLSSRDQAKCLQWLKFHEYIKSAKFAEFKYLEKTNYTVVYSPYGTENILSMV